MEKKLSFLRKMVNKLNVDGLYDFRIEERDSRVLVYDATEEYHINWLEDTNYELRDLCKEFNRPFKPLESDIIHDKLLKALKMDLGEKAYFEWENNVVLVVVK